MRFIIVILLGLFASLLAGRISWLQKQEVRKLNNSNYHKRKRERCDYKTLIQLTLLILVISQPTHFELIKILCIFPIFQGTSVPK